MTPGEVIALLPLFLAALVPACLVVSAFMISRGRARSLPTATSVTTLTAGLAYLAVFLRAVLAPFGLVPSTVPTSVANHAATRTARWFEITSTVTDATVSKR